MGDGKTPDDLTGVERELWDDAHTAYADEPDTLDRWRRDFLFMRGTEWKHMPAAGSDAWPVCAREHKRHETRRNTRRK